MYTIPISGNERRPMNAEVREYARLEYAHEDPYWVLSSALRASPTSRTPGHRGRFLRRARRSPQPVACKGSPRRTVEASATS